MARIAHEMLAHAALFWHGFWLPKVDAIISLTSSRLSRVTAHLLKKNHAARHYHWAMDIYPDVGVRLGELKDGPLARVLARLMRHAYKRAAHVVSLDQDMRDYLIKHYGVDSIVVEPFAPEIAWPAEPSAPGTTKRWLYSGNFGRAHEIEVLLQVQKRLEEGGIAAELVLQGQGAQFAASRDIAARLGVHRVEWRPPAPQEKLANHSCTADVLVVTRKAALKGLLLPSKLVLAELSGKSVLWIGDDDGKTAQRLRKEGRHGVFRLDEAESIAGWLQRLFRDGCAENPSAPRPARGPREDAIRQWEALLAT